MGHNRTEFSLTFLYSYQLLYKSREMLWKEKKDFFSDVGILKYFIYYSVDTIFDFF